MNLVIDVGNTRTKYAFFEGERLVGVNYQAEQLFDDINKWKSRGTVIDVFLSGSGTMVDDVKVLLKKEARFWLEASPLMELPLKIDYATPGTLGFDRIAICIGAMQLFPGYSLLVIDSGTCITFNYVTAGGVFLGGNISPGMDIRFRGLQQFTAKLPLVEPVEEYGGIGQTTEQAIRNGVMDGMLFEVENYIQRFLCENKNGKVVITGGNSHFLEKYLTTEVQFCKTLAFIGLNSVFRNVKKID